MTDYLTSKMLEKIREGNISHVQMLLENGVCVDDADFLNEAIYSIVEGNGSVGVIEILLEHGADPNGTAEIYNPLASAIRVFENAHDEQMISHCMELLLTAGADMDYATVVNDVYYGFNEETEGHQTMLAVGDNHGISPIIYSDSFV